MSTDYTVRLEQVFQGPMDLLLHLVREQEVEIQEIEISRILDGYLEYLDSLEKLDIEYAGDFLVMAATLMSIKSRSLLPHEELNLEDELDPRDELIQRLLEYRRFKGAADDLDRGFRERQQQEPRGYRGELRDESDRDIDLGELTVWDLLTTFSRLMRETLADKPHHVAADPRPMRFYVDQAVSILRRSQAGSTLRALIDALHGVPDREALIGSFCAVLELVRMEVIDVEQTEDGDDIRIAIRPEHRGDIEELVKQSALDGEVPEPSAAGDAAHGGAEADNGSSGNGVPAESP